MKSLSTAIQTVKVDLQTGHLTRAFLGSVLIAISAQVCINIFPVPMTLQTTSILLLSMISSPKVATGAVAFYIMEALVGLPVLAGFSGGSKAVFGTTGGYIFGFLALAWIASRFSYQQSNMLRRAGAAILGTAVLYICGVSWLSGFIGWDAAIQSGFIPFIYKIPCNIAFAVVGGGALNHWMKSKKQ